MGHLSFQADTTRDIAIARESIQRKHLPVVGSFSSAGPFVFGPAFYWILIVSYLIFPFTLFAPWILSEVFGLATILGFGYLGKILKDDVFSILLMLLASTSYQLILTPQSLTHHQFVIFFALLMMIFLARLFKDKKLVAGFCA